MLRKEKTIIEFINTSSLPLEPPCPATLIVPQWYKSKESYSTHDGKPRPTSVDDTDQTTATIKKCVPIFDAMTTGYIINTAVDIYVTQEGGSPYYRWPDLEYITFHSHQQVSGYPHVAENENVAKISNPWAIKTTKGHSCLFIEPMHRDTIFSIFPGIVDTDSYFSPIEFPFTLKKKGFEGLIPAGTPVAQIIPFKRQRWTSTHYAKSNSDLAMSMEYPMSNVFFNAYRNKFWEKKSFK